MNTKKTKYNKQLINMIITALFAAIITVVTAYILHIPTGINGSYIHIGDCFIYLAACFLPKPYAMCAGAIGAGLADYITPGAQAWVIPTLIIKSILTIPFTSKTKKIVNTRNIIGIILGMPITVIGYYIAEVIMFKNKVAPILSAIFPGILQPLASGVLFIIIGLALDKIDFKNKIQAYR